MQSRHLAVDISARFLGWAYDGGRNAPVYDAIELAGMKHRGKLYASVRNAVVSLFEAFQPDRIVWCEPSFVEFENVAQVHAAVRNIADLAAYDHEVKAQEASLRKARLAVLGQGDFGERDPKTGWLVADGGRRQARSAVEAWCVARSYEIKQIEVGNALVLHRYCEIVEEKRRGYFAESRRLGHHHPRRHAGQAAG